MNPTTLPGFPDPATAPIGTVNRQRVYKTPEGDFPSVTTILKVLGLGTEGLIRWSANIERAAVLEAAAEVVAGGFDGSPDSFLHLVEAKLGSSRQHQMQKDRAANIGTLTHQAVQRKLDIMLGKPVGPEPVLLEQSQLAVMAWEDWWKGSRLIPFKTEQPVWDRKLRYAGTIDCLAYDEHGDLGLLDLKTSKGIYDDQHLQVAGYWHAALNFADVRWARIVRIPKTLEDPLFKTAQPFEVRVLGDLYERQLTFGQLFEAFAAARLAYQHLMEK